MKWKIKSYLLKFIIALLLLFTAAKTYQAFTTHAQPITFVKQGQMSNEKEYIISEEMIMSKLKTRSQIVSLEQDLHKVDTKVDSSVFGERHTDLSVNGTYKLGLETKDIKVKYIDNENRIVYISLPRPILVSLDLPYNEIDFDKTQGFFRLGMNESEQKTFYKAVKNNIKKELMGNKELMKQADMTNRDVVTSILKLIPEVNTVIFE